MILDMAFSRLDPACRSASGRAVAVIDVIRATTTIVIALHHGCAGIIPVRTLGEARRDSVPVLVEELQPEDRLGCPAKRSGFR